MKEKPKPHWPPRFIDGPSAPPEQSELFADLPEQHPWPPPQSLWPALPEAPKIRWKKLPLGPQYDFWMEEPDGKAIPAWPDVDGVLVPIGEASKLTLTREQLEALGYLEPEPH